MSEDRNILKDTRSSYCFLDEQLELYTENQVGE